MLLFGNIGNWYCLPSNHLKTFGSSYYTKEWLRQIITVLHPGRHTKDQECSGAQSIFESWDNVLNILIVYFFTCLYTYFSYYAL